MICFGFLSVKMCKGAFKKFNVAPPKRMKLMIICPRTPLPSEMKIVQTLKCTIPKQEINVSHWCQKVWHWPRTPLPPLRRILFFGQHWTFRMLPRNEGKNILTKIGNVFASTMRASIAIHIGPAISLGGPLGWPGSCTGGDKLSISIIKKIAWFSVFYFMYL